MLRPVRGVTRSPIRIGASMDEEFWRLRMLLPETAFPLSVLANEFGYDEWAWHVMSCVEGSFGDYYWHARPMGGLL